MVLPVNFYTQWFWTVDLHNLTHFLRLRLHAHAQYEIRVYAEAIVEIVRPIAPCAMAAFEASLGKD
jgi:thymidylate synthase (FAD)